MTTPLPPPGGGRYVRVPCDEVVLIEPDLNRKCSRTSLRRGRPSPCHAAAVALVAGEYRCAQDLGTGVWIEYGLAWRWELDEGEGMSDEPTRALLALGGGLHGTHLTVRVSQNEAHSAHGIYHRRTVRFMQRDPANPRSQLLRRYWVADVMAHQSIADTPESIYGWWQSYADVSLFREYGRDVTGEPEEVARFRPRGEQE